MLTCRAGASLCTWYGLQAWRAALLFVAAGFFCRAITSAGHDIENLITALGERGLGDALPPSLHVEV